MIDWAMQIWNDERKNFIEYFNNAEVIKALENADVGKCIPGIGCQHETYTTLMKMVINQVLNKGLDRYYEYIDTYDIFKFETYQYIGDIHWILPAYDKDVLSFGENKEVMEYYYTTIDRGLCIGTDAMQEALSCSGETRTQALMRIAYTMVYQLKRLGYNL